MAMKVRDDVLPFRACTVATGNRPRLVYGITGFLIQLSWAIVGVNAFAHDSGIYQEDMMKRSGWPLAAGRWPLAAGGCALDDAHCPLTGRLAWPAWPSQA